MFLGALGAGGMGDVVNPGSRLYQGKDAGFVFREPNLHCQASLLYRAQQQDLAALQFLDLQKLSPERKLYKHYVGRIVYYRENPPGDARGGAFTFKIK